jgi:hypothetical protein
MTGAGTQEQVERARWDRLLLDLEQRAEQVRRLRSPPSLDTSSSRGWWPAPCCWAPERLSARSWCGGLDARPSDGPDRRLLKSGET